MCHSQLFYFEAILIISIIVLIHWPAKKAWKANSSCLKPYPTVINRCEQWTIISIKIYNLPSHLLWLVYVALSIQQVIITVTPTIIIMIWEQDCHCTFSTDQHSIRPTCPGSTLQSKFTSSSSCFYKVPNPFTHEQRIEYCKMCFLDNILYLIFHICMHIAPL